MIINNQIVQLAQSVMECMRLIISESWSPTLGSTIVHRYGYTSIQTQISKDHKLTGYRLDSV